MKLTKFTKYANLFDWAMSFACLGYGLYSGNLWWVAGGVIGLGVAALNPAKRVAGQIQAKLASKGS
jgi:hypothetical protein